MSPTAPLPALSGLTKPLLLAPMAGGITTPELLAAVCAAGAGGLLPGGYLTASKLEQGLTELRDRFEQSGQRKPVFGVNLFVPTPADRERDEAAVTRYREQLSAALDGEPGEPRWDDEDNYQDKLRLVTRVSPVPLVSFTFGCPDAATVASLHEVGSTVLVTVTDLVEAEAAAGVGADALVVQGHDAGGHRGTHAVAKQPNRLDALGLLPELASVGLPMVGAGGVATSGDVRRLLQAGAAAVQVGTAFLRCPEAGTSSAYRRLLVEGRETVVTRAFSGRPARGIRNAFIDEFDELAPAVNPQVDQVTKPIRAAATAADDPQHISGWAGTGWAAAQDIPAAEVVAELTRDL